MADGNAFVRNLLHERRQRLVGTIMRAAEQDLFPHVPETVRRAYRDTVLEAVGSYHDVVLDCMRASVNDGTVLNQDVERVLQGLRTDLRRVTRG